jgi:phage terminase large subunit-like protein
MTVSMQIRAAAELELRRRTRQRKFINPNPIKWMQEHFIIPETGTAIQLEPYQKQAMREALKRTDGEHFDHSVIIWSDVKKSAKSTIAAAVALWYAFQVEWGQIVIVANDLKQADSRVGFYLRRAIELNPELAKLCKIIKYRVELPNHTFIEMVPIDPSGEAGGNADAVIYSELWGAHEEGKQRMWTETTLPPNKMGKAFRWVETYAGYSGESILLEQLYQQATRQGERIKDTIAPLYINRPARMFAMWNQQGRMPWHTQEYYAQEEAVLLPNEFKRIHQNTWVTSEDIFVPLEWWDACKYDQGIAWMAMTRPLDGNDPMVIAMDAGVSSDNFAIVGVSRHPVNDNLSVVRYSRRWIPPRDGKIDFQGTADNPGPELEIRRLCQQYNVIEVAYDPMQLEDMAGRLRKEGIAWFRPFSQAKERLVADNMLRQMIQDRRVLHSGEADLREHIGNANAQVDAEERKIRIIKRSPLLKIDLAVALSMANADAMRLNL